MVQRTGADKAKALSDGIEARHRQEQSLYENRQAYLKWLKTTPLANQSIFVMAQWPSTDEFHVQPGVKLYPPTDEEYPCV